jgi:hypothetical protein
VKGLTTLPPRNKYGPGGIKNKGILMREHLMKQEINQEQKRFKKMQKISKKWKTDLKQKEEERKKHLEETKVERKAQRQKEREARKKKYENLVKRNEERVKEKQAKLQEISEQLKQQSKQEREATKGQREKWKENHQEFLEKQKEMLKKEMESLVKERKELENIEKEAEKREKEVVSNVKKQVIQYFEENKEKLYFDKKEKEEVKNFINKASVKAVFDKYDRPLRYFFDFYSKSEHHDIGFELDSNMETMNYKEFIRFGYQTHIIPTLIPIEEMTHTFRLLVRERQDELDNEKMQVLDYGYFLKALVRISAIAQDYLGGQKGKKLEKRMEELEGEKQKTQKIKTSLAKKYGKVGNQTDRDSENSLDRGGETSGNETGKETDRSKPEISKRGGKKPRKKVIKAGFKDNTLKNASVLKNVVSEAEILKRKSQNVNKILTQGAKAEIYEHLKKVKVEDKRVTRRVDVDLITSKTIECLLNYFELLPEDDKYSLDKKLNQAIRSNVGVKPNKMIKTIVPEKADVVDKDTSDEEDGTGRNRSNSPETNKSKTEKTGQSESEDDDGKATQK